MPSDNQALTRAVRARMAVTGEKYTQALTALTAVPRMDRDTTGGGADALGFAQLMTVGAWAARDTGDAGLPAAVTAVRAAVLPLWGRTVPGAARDVLVACADLAVTSQVTSLPEAAGVSEIAAGMLDLTVTWDAGGRSLGFTSPLAFASSCAFGRDDEDAVLEAVCVLLALAHPAGTAPDEDDRWGSWDGYSCVECGGTEPGGTYGCGCFDEDACPECGGSTQGAYGCGCD